MKALSILIILFLLSKSLGAAETQKVSLQLQWLHQFQFAGFYVAKEKGYYKEAGLDLQIKKYRHQTDIISDIKNQTTTYATGRSSLIIEQSRSQDFVILDAIFEHSPSVLITTNPKINHPSDLKNKKIMVTSDQVNASSLYAMLISQGISKADIIEQKHSFDINDLLGGKTDAMASYLSNEPFNLSQQGIDFTILNPKDYGYDFYGDLLFTSQKELYENPQRAKKFVHASRRGWREAFENVESTAKLIFEKYNEQNKSLESLIYEGNVLKTLWCDNPKIGPVLSYNRFEMMAQIYILNNLIATKPNLQKFLDPLHFIRHNVTIGVLAKRGVENAVKTWKPLIDYLNNELPRYSITLKSLTFEEIDRAVKESSIDFVLTNSMQYIQLEAKYGSSRLATLINDSRQGPISDYGAVIFTHSENRYINSLDDLKHKTFAAVNKASFGGWIMAKKALLERGIKEKDFKSLNFLQTHDRVIEAVLNKSVEAGTVRSDTLEALSRDAKIDLTKIKILNQLHYENFPYLVSTELYPEWSFAKIATTNNEIASDILSKLLDSSRLRSLNLPSWSIPLNYKPIHDLLKTLKLEPYKPVAVSYKTIIKQYYLVIIAFISLIIILLLFNRYLNTIVHKRTSELLQANKTLESLAHTDELTQIANRRQFLQMAEQYFMLSKRNKTPLVLLYLDIDWFKDINDTYGHHVGDEILKLFSRTIEKHLRKSDLFGRIGGEEFSILLQNTSDSNALLLADKMRQCIQETPYFLDEKEKISFSVSIGVSSIKDEYSEFSQLMKMADTAVYKAKETGRNRVVLV